MKLTLAQFGLNPKTDVNITQVGGAAARLTALQAGSIDAAVLTLGLVQIAQKSDLSLLFDSPKRYRVEKVSDYRAR